MPIAAVDSNGNLVVGYFKVADYHNPQSRLDFLSCGGFAVSEHGPPPGAMHEQPDSLL
jgi:hypothetical protein